jgi:hypothetical protein
VGTGFVSRIRAELFFRIEANWARRCGDFLMDGHIAFYTVEAERIVIVGVVDSRMDVRQEMSK